MHSAAQPSPHSEITNYERCIIVAGTRDWDDERVFNETIDALVTHSDKPIIFISGKARTGADAMIIAWCRKNNHPWVEFPADWDNIDVPGAVVRERGNGKKFNVVAGHQRNAQMRDVATEVVIFWDGKSTGTRNMRDIALAKGLHVQTILIDVTKRMNHHVWQSESRRGGDTAKYRQALAWKPEHTDLS